MAAAKTDVHTAVVLQGGGALGAYEYGVLKALYEQRPGFSPAAVAGISIGAITAAVLGGASDFSRSSIEARIEAGYADAIAQGIGRPDASGLRAGTTAGR